MNRVASVAERDMAVIRASDALPVKRRTGYSDLKRPWESLKIRLLVRDSIGFDCDVRQFADALRIGDSEELIVQSNFFRECQDMILAYVIQ